MPRFGERTLSGAARWLGTALAGNLELFTLVSVLLFLALVGLCWWLMARLRQQRERAIYRAGFCAGYRALAHRQLHSLGLLESTLRSEQEKKYDYAGRLEGENS